MIPNVNPIQKLRGAKLNWTCWLRKQNMEGVYVKISHIFNAVQSFDSVVFFFIQDETVRGDLSSLSASRAFSMFVLFLTGDLRIKPVDTDLPSDLWIWQRSLLNALSIKKQQQKKNQASSLVFFPFSSLPVLLIAHSSFLLSTCLSCCGLVWILWIPSPLQCIRLETPQMPALGKLQKKQKKQEKVMGWRCQLWQIKLCHTPITSLSLIIRPETRKHTHSDTHKQQAGKQRHKRGALLTMREPDDTDLEIRWDVFLGVETDVMKRAVRL